MKTRMKTSTLAIAALLCGSVASAQAPQRGLYDFDFIKGSNPWLTSANAAGLGTLQPDRTSVIEADFNKEDGGIAPSYGSDNSLQAGLSTESFVRISDKVAFKGMLSYSFFNGQNMGGQTLLNPSYNPVNFVETNPDNTGTKVREFFAMEGGIAYSFNEKWSLGFNFEYETGYSAKRKDPRPFSNWMYMDMTFGGRYAPTPGFSVGLNAEYRRTNEHVGGSIYGTTDKSYFIMTDYGGYFGTSEMMDNNANNIFECGSNITNGRPMFNQFIGGALQLTFGKADKVQFFNEITYLNRKGNYGERTNNYSSLEYFKHSGSSISYNGVINITKSQALHKICLYGEYSGLDNYENIYRINTIPGQQTSVEYFGENLVLKRTDIKGRLSYVGYLGIDNFRPKWEYGVLIDGTYRMQSATIYPYYRDHNCMNIDANLYGKRNITYKKNIFTVMLGAGYFMGFGTAKEDGVLASSTSKAPTSLDVYLDKDFEYNTASRAAGTIAFRYTRLFGSKVSAFLDLRDTYHQLLAAPQFLSGSNRNSITLTLGCTF